MPARFPIVVTLALGAVVSASGSVPFAQNSGQTVFRGSAVLVPVDVRVLDRDGKAITDLKASDFTIKENGLRQEIRHFSSHTMTADAPAADAPLRRTTPEPAITTPNRRVFLIALGRGRLKDVSGGLDALDAFVRERLLPQDQVAVIAWNRATDFTTDRAKIGAVLSRFRERHETVETELRLYFSGLAALYATAIPKYIQDHIDHVFYGADGPPARTTLPDARLNPAEADVRRNADQQLASTIAAFNGRDTALTELASAATLGANFDDYVALSRQTLQDFGNLLAGVEYLRFVEGEKHLVFVTEYGMLMPSADYDRDLGALAADARVAIDTIQTGGVNAGGVGSSTAVSASSGFALSALRTVAETSGGQHSVSNYADQAFDRILSATGFGYVLGYTPSKPVAEGGFRRIAVEVNRRGVNVAHRRGYFARAEPETFDPRRIMATTRLNAAANYSGDIGDLKITVKATDVREGARSLVSVETSIAADRIVFGFANGRHLAALSQIILCTDESGRSEGGLTRDFDVRVPPALFDQVRRTGIKSTVQVPVGKPPIFVKVFIYDYGSDLLGSTYVRMH
jgi:VWFA-related protein